MSTFVVDVEVTQGPFCWVHTNASQQFKDKKLSDGREGWKIVGWTETSPGLFDLRLGIDSDADIEWILSVATSQRPPNGMLGFGKVIGIEERGISA